MRIPLHTTLIWLLAPVIISAAMQAGDYVVVHVGGCRVRGHYHLSKKEVKCWKPHCTVWFPTGRYFYTCMACYGTSQDQQDAPKPACFQHPYPYTQLKSHGQW
ncbi:hypothetical protein PCASD_14451 [Puccinia coronata f. sp. avenae]|uniref:Secreted protein n=1 Tax=Puccinia coronata f. sp. avenae TaxID=200324 RepID=A0A2N5UDM5_9BASI|nr:hypothetical protein PCASD_14451 [Puccinia coronata f. sp. avenae]